MNGAKYMGDERSANNTSRLQRVSESGQDGAYFTGAEWLVYAALLRCCSVYVNSTEMEHNVWVLCGSLTLAPFTAAGRK